MKSDVATLIAGEFFALVASVWPEERIKDYLLATAARRHVWHAWLAAQDETALANPQAACRHLTLGSAAKLLGEVHEQVPQGLIRALGRLGPLAQPRQAYSDLAMVLAEGGRGAKLLRHAKSIDANLLSVLVALPPVLRLISIVGHCGIDNARYLNWLFRTAGAADPELFAGFLSKLNGVSDDLYPMELVEEYLKPEHFPPPPFEVRPPLKWISSRTEMRAIERRFRNCLGTHAVEVFWGSLHLYLWESDEPAIIALDRIGSVGWRIGEHAGLQNRQLSPRTRVAIADAFGEILSIYSDSLRHAEAPRRAAA